MKDLLAAGQNIADARMNLIRAMQQLPAARSDLKLRIQKQLDVLYYDQDPGPVDCGREGQLFNPMNIIDKLNWPRADITPTGVREWYIESTMGLLGHNHTWFHRSEFLKALRFTPSEAELEILTFAPGLNCRRIKI